MHQAQCSISSVYPRDGGADAPPGPPTAVLPPPPLSVVSSVGVPSFALATVTRVSLAAPL